MTVDERNGGNTYVKVLLYAYPHLPDLSEALLQSAQNKALLSYKKTDAFAAAQNVAEEILLRGALQRLMRDLEWAIGKLSPQERSFVDYKYFRREKGAFVLACSERSYYRKQKALLLKAGALLRIKGWTQESFLQEFRSSMFFMRLYKAVSEGNERALVPKRTKKALLSAQTKSSDSSLRTV